MSDEYTIRVNPITGLFDQIPLPPEPDEEEQEVVEAPVEPPKKPVIKKPRR